MTYLADGIIMESQGRTLLVMMESSQALIHLKKVVGTLSLCVTSDKFISWTISEVGDENVK